MKLYGIPNCGTVKKARVWLDEHGVAYEFHDYKKQGVDATTLDNWLAQMSWEKLINRSGITWRGLTDDEKAAVTDNASAAKLMQAKPSVIRRPIIVRDNRIVAVGFDADTYRTLL